MPLNFAFNSQLEKYKLAIASQFANTILPRYVNGAISKYIIVPILFSQNSQWYDIANSKVLRDQNVSAIVESNIPVPSMTLGYQITPIEENLRNQNFTVTDDVFTPAALEMTAELTINTKRTTDSEMIIEQILPLFRNKRSVTVNITDEIKQEITISLTDIDLGFPEEWEKEDVGLIESILTFSTKVYIYRLPTLGSTNPALDIDFELVARNDFLSEVLVERSV